jgi:di/tricarboxylate transporter
LNRLARDLRFLLWPLAAALAVALSAWEATAQEPSPLGQSVDAVLAKDATNRTEATAALIAAGSDALAILPPADVIADKAARERIEKIRSSILLNATIARLDDPSEEVRVQTETALKARDRKLLKALPELKSMKTDEGRAALERVRNTITERNARNQIITLIVLFAVIVGLLQEKFGAELVMLTALLILTLFNVVSIQQALDGFSNAAILTIAALFVVGAGLQSTGAMEYLGAILLGRPKPGTPLGRLITPVAGLSAFTNNTTLVAFFLPIFISVAKKIRVSPSKLLIPLSYASILGGTCTLIGTSTNLVVDGTLRDEGLGGMTMFELAPIGVPITIIGVIFLATVGQRLLPDRKDLLEYAENHPREYTAELIVRDNCPFVGQTIRASGLRDLPGLYLYQIERAGELMSPVAPSEKVQVNDLLYFSGVVGTIIDVQRIRGLDPVEHHEATTDAAASGNTTSPKAAPRTGHQLAEVVISQSSPLVGLSVKDSDFRSRYQVSILAVHRSGQKLAEKIGKIVLQAGDTLLVDAGSDFAKRWRNSRDFILVSGLDDSAPVEHHRAWRSLGIIAFVVLGMSLAPEMAVIFAMMGAVATIFLGCVSGREAMRSMDLSVLLLVASALGVSRALDTSGAAEWLAEGLLTFVKPMGPVAILAALVFLTGILTELLSNNACAALMGTLAIATAKSTGLDPRPLLLAVAVTSSYGFATPIGYQTNLMVLNPGGYKFSDYLKIGIPLDLICWTMTVIILPLVWNLQLPR